MCGRPRKRALTLKLLLSLLLMLGSCGPIVIPPFPQPTPPIVEPTPTPTPLPTPVPTPEPTPVPTPPPEPEPTPSPVPLPEVNWNDSTSADNCPEGGVGEHREVVEGVLTDLVESGVVSFPFVGKEADLYNLMVAGLGEEGLASALYGEELAVASGNSRSENYDLLLSSKERRIGPSTFRSTCFPATRSESLGASPTPGPTPPSSPGDFWSDRPKHPCVEVRIKLFVPSSQRPDGRAVIDGVALFQCGGRPECGGRARFPVCGLEGDPLTFECSVANPPTWKGGDEHPTNPWLRFARPGTRVKATYKGVESNEVVAR